MAVLTALAVGVGGTLGAVARYAVGERIERRGLDTLVVNVLGSVLLGVVLSAPIDGPLELALGAGVCGAFTTFSSFAVTTVRQVEDGRSVTAALYAFGTLALALGAVSVGLAVGQRLGG